MPRKGLKTGSHEKATQPQRQMTDEGLIRQIIAHHTTHVRNL